MARVGRREFLGAAAWASLVGACGRRGAALAAELAKRARSPTDRRRLAYAIAAEVEHEYGADVAELSLFERDHGEDLPGGDALLPDGYDRLLAPLAAGVTVELGQVVTAIAHGPAGVVVLTTSGRFTAPRALITLPIGVLAADAVGFTPPLPAAKRAAIGHLGSGLLDKLCLRFPTAFWDPSALIGYVAERPGAWAETLNLQAVAGAPVLMMFNAAGVARAFEARSDDEIVVDALAALRAMYGPEVPAPVAAQVTRWGRDPFARGAYSFVRPGGGARDHDALAAPVDDRLYFAGEATHRAFPATVHGAYLSGVAAARAIVAAAG